MEIGNRIRYYRKEKSLSQDQLAEKLFVTRQTISNWENDKSYPDVKSLVLLSEVFEVSIDKLIKGDIEEMKEIISNEDKTRFIRLSRIYTVCCLIIITTPIPLLHFFGYTGICIWVLFSIFGLYVANLVEKQKKKYDIQTYKEIVAFLNGKSLNEIEKAREEGKRPYQKTIMVVCSCLITLLISVVFILIFKMY